MNLKRKVNILSFYEYYQFKQYILNTGFAVSILLLLSIKRSLETSTNLLHVTTLNEIKS